MKVNTKTYENFTWYDCEKASYTGLKKLNLPIDIPENFIEDSLELGHLPKYEKQGDLELIILRASSTVKQTYITNIGQMSNKIAFIIYGKNLISVHRKSFDFIKDINREFKSIEGLLFYLIKKMINSFEKPLDQYSKSIDDIERSLLLNNAEDISVEKLYYTKSKARMHKKVIQINQNVINQLAIKNAKFATELQDIKDTMLNLLITADEVIEDSQALHNSYLSITAQKNNDVMKLLTVFSVFFLPLTFIAGIYGMNFEFMPELDEENAYYIVLAVMVVICVGIWIWFRKKKIL